MGFLSKFFKQNCLKFLFGCLVVALLLPSDGLAQRPPYSLQSAVDELHRREAAKYPLNAPPSQTHFFGALGSSSDLDYWDEDSNYPGNTNNYNDKLQNRHRINKALAKYLERENYEADRGGLSLGPFGGYEFDDESASNNPFFDEKKRSSFFRERDNKYDASPNSIFREREVPTSGGSELTEEFLREIEEAQEREREKHFTESLRQLLEKYKANQPDNDLSGTELFDEKKRMRMPPYYMLMQKKRSYPILPYLPYDDRKKRFPVAKRSAKRSSDDLSLNDGKPDDRVVREINEILNDRNADDDDEKKKRSVEEDNAKSTASAATSSSGAATTSSTTTSQITLDKKNSNNDDQNGVGSTSEPSSKVEVKKGDDNDSAQMATDTHGNDMTHKMHAGFHDHSQKQHKHRKRSNHQHSQEHHSREEESEEHEDDDDEEDGDDHDEEHEEEHEEAEAEGDGEYGEDEERKKKREVSSVKGDIEALPLKDSDKANFKELIKSRAKKSIQWSKYFGIDRKKKAKNLDVKKRSAFEDELDFEDTLKKRQDLDPEKIDNMDRKLQYLEDYIIDNTIKYTGAHEGINSQAEIRRLKERILSRLATAYNLEKMRRALDNLRQSLELENHLGRNIIESLDSNDLKMEGKLGNQKRLSVKKEQPTPNEASNDLSYGPEKSKDLNSNALMSTVASRNKEDDDKKKKQKKRNSYLRYPAVPNDLNDFEDEMGAGNYESLNDAYLGNKNYIIGSNQCPIIESMAERCQGVDLLSGDFNQELLAACGVHQICYLCGTSQISCDYQYLAEADAICGNNNDCQAAARSVLMILRGSPGTQLGPRECLKTPCLYSAMREIGL